MKKMIKCFMACAMTIAMVGCQSSKDEGFKATLDTEKKVSLDISGFLGNFEALDQVVNDFNEVYPNVTVHYEQMEKEQLYNYLENNPKNDIFMTNDASIKDKENKNSYAASYCLDLSKEDLDVSNVDKELLSACSVDEKLLRIPLARMMCGIVVNKTLLDKAGCQMPTNYQEFMKVCQKLKEKGYTPIQGATNHVGSDLILPMALSTLGTNDKLTKQANNNNYAYLEKLRPVYKKVKEIVDQGYTSHEINQQYPFDNYDQAILKFFEGDVPFWVCNTESVSGMKKRESKSEAYSKNSFDYEFMNAPLGDKGSYDYEEPWYGFSINKKSDNKDYALEFMRFLTTKDELNKIAEVKGMPSVTNSSEDIRFKSALQEDNIVQRYIYDGKLNNEVNVSICSAANRMFAREVTTVDEALELFKK